MEILISPTGMIRILYQETLNLTELGLSSITRASHVEPDSTGHWWADLAPVNGPRLGPFTQRSQALNAEIDWLQAHQLPLPS